MAESAVPAPSLSLGALAWVFFRVGATAFGETELVIVERELVERRGVLTHQDLTDALTYTKPLPGSTVVQIVAYLAYRIGGWPGAAVATLGYLLPSTLAMMALAAGYLASLHMLQFLLVALVAPALGLLGIPDPVWKRLAARAPTPGSSA